MHFSGGTVRRAWIAVAAIFAIALGGLVAIDPPAPADAAIASAFDPGNIIDDSVFYNSSAMTAQQVQDFLSANGPACAAGYTCLKSYSTPTTTRAAVANRCSTYQGGSSESAAVIIWKVAQACGINPQVLIVLLQKEQGLVTSSAPSSTRYRSATGYGCPDTAACDSLYYGFFNQVYMAAYQFQSYRNNAGAYSYQAGRVNAILYSPNAACGRASIYIANQATAGLYDYTPYTPNAAAMANLYGLGDGCSSYGNRNFWAYFTDWFGTPNRDLHAPVGSLDQVTGGYGVIDVAGWAIDPDVSSAIQVHIYVDNVFSTALTADGSRPDVGAVYPSAGPNHGFSGEVTASTGTHQVCLWAINVGAGFGNPQIDCKTAVVQEAVPRGTVTSMSVVPGVGAQVGGWTLDEETTAPIGVDMYVDGVYSSSTVASQTSTEIPTDFASYGAGHGFSVTVPTSPGTHSICAYGINVGHGWNALLGCGTITLASGAPRASFDQLTASPGAQNIAGWALDPDTTSPITVHVYADGVFQKAIQADGNRPDIAAAFPGYGAAHGFSTTLALAAGTHQVCLYGINVGPGGNTLIGCRSIVVRSGPPLASFDSATVVAGGEAIGGWALDPDTADPITVHLYVDGVFQQAITADGTRNDIAAAFPGYGAAHGVSAMLDLAPGPHSVCLYGINVGPGANTLIGCRSVTVSSGSPVGSIDGVVGGQGTVSVAGWALDPDTASPITVHAYVDGVFASAVTADGTRSDIAALFPSWGAAHGFSTAIPVPAGSHSVCLYALSVGRGDNALLGCRTVAVS